MCTTIKTGNHHFNQEMRRPHSTSLKWGRCQMKSELIQLMPKVYGGAFDVLRGSGLTVRAFDGQMSAPTYVGAVNFDSGFSFPTMKEVEVFDGAMLMWSEEKIQALRDAAK